jgi:hypothetical protein
MRTHKAAMSGAILIALIGCSSGDGGDKGGDNPGLPVPQGFTVSITSPQPNVTTGSLVNLTFKTSDTTAIFECNLDGFLFSCNPSGNPTQILPHGPHSFSVKGTQTGGNSLTVQSDWNVDAQGPQVVIVSPNAAFTASSGTFSFTTDDAVFFLCSFDGGPSNTCFDGGVFSGLIPGIHTLEVTGFDSLNNSSTIASVSFTVN